MAIHALAGAVGGVAAGGLLGSIGSITPAAVRTVIGIVVASTVLVSSIAFSGYEKYRVLAFDRETPQSWVRTSIGWAVRNGATLGIGFATRIGFISWYLIPLFAFTAGAWSLGVLVYGGYGLFRATFPALIAWSMQDSPEGEIGDRLLAWRPVASRTDVFTALIASSGIVVVLA